VVQSTTKPRKRLGVVATCRVKSTRQFPNGWFGHSGLMPANLITLLHFSTSSLMNLANSPGEFATAGMTPSSMSRCLILGSPRAVLISLLSVAMMSGGVAAGAPKPTQPSAS